jgi:hypothetical protein
MNQYMTTSERNNLEEKTPGSSTNHVLQSALQHGRGRVLKVSTKGLIHLYPSVDFGIHLNTKRLDHHLRNRMKMLENYEGKKKRESTLQRGRKDIKSFNKRIAPCNYLSVRY